MIVVTVPFPHIHVWVTVARYDTRSTITVIYVVTKLTSYIGLTERNSVRVVCWKDWR